MNQELMNRILRCPALPSLPAVAVQVIELTSRPDASLDELAAVIQNDQALAAKILRTVNSSFYALRRPCANISQALVMLGLSSVKSLALSFSLVASLGSGSGEGFDFIAYWRRGLYTAVAARCLARAAGVLQEDEAFLGGLLQDVGMVAMYRSLGDQYLGVVGTGDHRTLGQRELQVFELQHPDVGAMLAEKWRLPIELIVPVRYHERPTAAPREYAGLVRCVALGNTAHDVLTDPEPAPALRRYVSRCAEWLELDGAVADDLLKKISEATRQLAPLFQIETGAASDAESILSRARTQLSTLATQASAEEPASFSGLLADSEHRDPLSGMLLPGAIAREADSAFDRAAHTGMSLVALHLSIDRFDRIATAGSDATDAVVVETATLMDAHLSSSGALLGHAGHGQFIAVIPGMDRFEAFRCADALKLAIAGRSPGWSLPGSIPTPLTVSTGLAAFEPAGDSRFTSGAMLLLAARRASEAASAEGGDRVRAFIPRAAAA